MPCRLADRSILQWPSQSSPGVLRSGRSIDSPVLTLTPSRKAPTSISIFWTLIPFASKSRTCRKQMQPLLVARLQLIGVHRHSTQHGPLLASSTTPSLRQISPNRSSRNSFQPTIWITDPAPLALDLKLRRHAGFGASACSALSYGNWSIGTPTKSGSGKASNRKALMVFRSLIKALHTRCMPSITRPSGSMIIG